MNDKNSFHNLPEKKKKTKNEAIVFEPLQYMLLGDGKSKLTLVLCKTFFNISYNFGPKLTYQKYKYPFVVYIIFKLRRVMTLQPISYTHTFIRIYQTKNRPVPRI